VSVPPTTSTSTERESHWPFVVHAQIVAVPAPLARIGIGLLVAIVGAIAASTWILVLRIDAIAEALALHRR